MNEPSERLPGVCVSWEEQRKLLAEIKGDEELVKAVWEHNDFLAYLFIWHCLLSF